MTFSDYKEKMKERLQRYFDIEEDYKLQEFRFDLFAKSNIRNERYIASKKMTIYAFENNEYCFLKYFEALDKKNIDNLTGILKNSMNKFVKPSEEHMSTVLTGIIVTNNLDKTEAINQIKKFKYQKSFLFGLKGWVDIRLILVDLSTQKVITSKKANKVEKFYQP